MFNENKPVNTMFNENKPVNTMFNEGNIRRLIKNEQIS